MVQWSLQYHQDSYFWAIPLKGMGISESPGGLQLTSSGIPDLELQM